MSVALKPNALNRLAQRMTSLAERWLPDAFVFALLGTLLVVIAAFSLGAGPQAIAKSWGDGVWSPFRYLHFGCENRVGRRTCKVVQWNHCGFPHVSGGRMRTAIPQACHSARLRVASSMTVAVTFAFGCSGGSGSQSASDTSSISDGDIADVSDTVEDVQPAPCGGDTCQPTQICVTDYPGEEDTAPWWTYSCVAISDSCKGTTCECLCPTWGGSVCVQTDTGIECHHP